MVANSERNQPQGIFVAGVAKRQKAIVKFITFQLMVIELIIKKNMRFSQG